MIELKLMKNLIAAVALVLCTTAILHADIGVTREQTKKNYAEFSYMYEAQVFGLVTDYWYIPETESIAYAAYINGKCEVEGMISKNKAGIISGGVAATNESYGKKTPVKDWKFTASNGPSETVVFERPDGKVFLSFSKVDVDTYSGMIYSDAFEKQVARDAAQHPKPTATPKPDGFMRI